MAISFPLRYDEAFRRVWSYDPSRLGTYVNEVKELSDLFLRKRVDPVYFSRSEILRAYSFFFFPQNYLKASAILSLFPDLWEGKRDLRVLDFGGGPGNSTLALRDSLQERVNEIVYVDKQREGWELLRSIDGDPKIKAHSLSSLAGPIDIYLFSYTLKEVGEGIFGILRELKRHESSQAVYIFLDAPDRDVLVLIDRMRRQFAREGYGTLFPCRSGGPCPLLELTRDVESVCFSQLPWTPPPLVEEINSRLRFYIKFLKFASLVVMKGAEGEEFLFSVSPYIGEKGKGRAFFCAPEGRLEVERLEKERSEANASLDELHRGSLVEWSRGEELSGRVRIDRFETLRLLTDLRGRRRPSRGRG
ncbi:MAG TPA: hypothetical protein PKK98_05170 [Candidatus Aminicenantes bacterium]|nr:hypothetical protein [Candidatus Aminicenantes bacterium]